MRMTAQLTGTEQVLSNLGILLPRLARAGSVAATNRAHAILRAAQADAPVISGNLRASGRVRGVRREGMRMVVDIEFPIIYARRVHENPRSGKTGGVSPSGRRYKRWSKTGKWHFLQDAIANASRGLLGQLSQDISREMGWRR